MNSWLSKVATLTAVVVLLLLRQVGTSLDAGATVPGAGPGYWIMTGNGTGFSFRAPPISSQSGISCAVSPPGTNPAPRCSGIATFPDGSGYWISGYIPWWHDGILDTGGDATAFAPPGGCETGAVSNAPVVGVASAHEGAWLVATDGAVFGLCGAGFYGSMGGTPLNKPVVGIAATPDGKGYWLVASDGGIFAFGDAAFYGSMGGTPLNKPVVGIAATPDGKGYWLVASDGGIFAFGDAGFYGSTGGTTIASPMVGIAANPDGTGYWTVGADGGVFAFGDAPFLGSEGGSSLDAPIVGIAARR
jgi:hypothetical protein